MNSLTFRRTGFLLGLICSALILGACEYTSRPDNAVERRFTWFSYLSAEDIKESCRSHSPPRYRFIYNAIYTNHVRTYEINGLPGGGGGMMDSEVLSAEVSPGFLVHFPFWPWSGERVVAQLNEVEMKMLRTSLEASGYFDSPPVGTILDSNTFYWLVASCEGNRFHFNAWVHPSPEFDGLKFVETLRRFDGSKIEIPQARELTPEEKEFRRRPARAQEPGYFRFFAEILPDGLGVAAGP